MYHLIYLFSLLPLRVLYAISDVAFILAYHAVRYRRDVVRSNLTTSFPEKSIKEIKHIERQFYHWLCDYGVETIKLLSIGDKELRRRFTISGADKVEAFMAEGKDCAALLGHYCNWEWLSQMGIAFPPERKMGLIYKPLKSKPFDRLFRKIRSTQPSSIVIPKQDILRTIVSLKRENKRSFLGYISDQGPRWTNIHLWLPFLNHDTPVFTGGERIMRKVNNVVFYISMSRPRRGYYHADIQLISAGAASEPEFALTRRFFQLLENDIRREPAFYLWTHKRWKRTHEEFNRMYKVVNGKVVAKD